MRTTLIPILASLALTAPQAPSRVTVASVQAEIAQLVAESGAEVAVVWRPLDSGGGPGGTGAGMLINPVLRFHAASMMKVPIMIELYRQAHESRLKLDDTTVVTNRFRSIVDGSPYELSATEDSDGDVYKAIGQPLSYRQLCESMMTVSSNLAANVLIETLGARQIRITSNSLGAGGIEVLRGVEDQKAFDRGMNNTTDASSLAVLFWKLGTGQVVSSEASAEMVEILKRQKFNTGIPAGVPPGTIVAHKTGSITRIRHDGGIVYAPKPYVLVVLVRGIQESAKSDALIADISKRVFALGQ